ncbi:hypothetical protein [Neomegalonema sp.]|uniref:hypothetical protein n=1 Tax=Neomegalonema sp. TaxID=2039713 RepID=UPI002606C159|nr:hypothetical protein [Neomegalonema sp.]MDD2866955.1 hypothetical protein [Neomegalonema sp.]
MTFCSPVDPTGDPNFRQRPSGEASAGRRPSPRGAFRSLLRRSGAPGAAACALLALAPAALAQNVFQPKSVIPWLGGEATSAPRETAAPVPSPIQAPAPAPVRSGGGGAGISAAPLAPMGSAPAPILAPGPAAPFAFNVPAEPPARIVIPRGLDPETSGSSVISPQDLTPQARGSRIDSGEGLAAPSAEGAGLAGAFELGLPQDMWRGSDPDAAEEALKGLRPTPYQAANGVLQRFLVATAPPPPGAEGVAALRARALLDLGAPDAAARLADLARSAKDPAAERAGAEAALIAGRDAVYCSVAHNAVESAARTQDLDGFWIGMRAYCLAREGNPMAAVAVSAMRERGRLDPLTAQLIEAVLDKGMKPFVQLPPADGLDPLRLAALRLLEIPPPAEGARIAPLALLPAYLASPSAEPEAKIVAAERLEAAGAVSTSELVAAYERYGVQPGGGAFARARAVLAAAQGVLDPGAVAEALVRASRDAGPQGFASLARSFAPFLASAAPGSMPPELAFAARDSLLMAGDAEAARRWTPFLPSATPVERADAAALLLLTDPAPQPPLSPEDRAALETRAREGDRSTRLILMALEGLDPNGRIGPAAPYVQAAHAGRQAEASLGALKALAAEGADLRPETLAQVMRALSLSGLGADARRIAAEAALLTRWP